MLLFDQKTIRGVSQANHRSDKIVSQANIMPLRVVSQSKQKQVANHRPTRIVTSPISGMLKICVMKESQAKREETTENQRPERPARLNLQ